MHRTVARALTCLAATTSVTSVAHASQIDVFQQLPSPVTGLAIGSDQTVYATDAGTAGKVCPKGVGCMGRSGQVLALKDGQKKIVMNGLLSWDTQGWGGGPNSVAVDSAGTLFTTLGFALPDSPRVPAWARAQDGHVMRSQPGSAVPVAVANVKAPALARQAKRSRADRWTAPGAIVAVSDHLLVAVEGSEAVFEIRSGQVKTYATGPKDWYPQGLAPMPDGTVLVATYDGVWRVPSGGGKVRAVDIDLAGTVDGTAAGRSIVGAASTANGTFHLLVAGEAEQYEFWDAINRLRLAGTKHGAKKLTSSMVRLAYSWLPNATLLSYYPDGTQEMTELGLDAIAVAASDDGAYVSLGNPPKRKFGLSSRGTKQLARLSKGDRERAAELMRALNAPPRILKVAR